MAVIGPSPPGRSGGLAWFAQADGLAFTLTSEADAPEDPAVAKSLNPDAPIPAPSSLYHDSAEFKAIKSGEFTAA